MLKPTLQDFAPWVHIEYEIVHPINRPSVSILGSLITVPIQNLSTLVTFTCEIQIHLHLSIANKNPNAIPIIVWMLSARKCQFKHQCMESLGYLILHRRVINQTKQPAHTLSVASRHKKRGMIGFSQSGLCLPAQLPNKLSWQKKGIQESAMILRKQTKKQTKQGLLDLWSLYAKRNAWEAAR